MENQFIQKKIKKRSNIFHKKTSITTICKAFFKFLKKLSPLNFCKLPLSTQIIASIFIGTGFGILLRYFPHLLDIFGLTTTSFQTLGNAFINLIKMISMPLIFACIMSSVVSLGKQASTGKTTIIAFISFFSMSIMCITIGSCLTLLLKPGLDANFDTNVMIEQYSHSINNVANTSHRNTMSFSSFLLNIVPSNIFVSFVESNFLQIIFFAIIVALAITRIDKKHHIASGVKTFADICMECVQIVMKVAPIGTFGMITWLIATQKIDLLKSLGKFICVDFLSAGVAVYGGYSLICILVLRLNPTHLWKKLFPAQLIALLTTSTTAALPAAMEIAEKKLGISEEKTRFVIPFSAAINTSGSSMYFSAMTIFIAQLFNIDLTYQQYITLFTMSIMCSFGTAPVPGGALFLLGNIFIAVGIPLEALSIAFAVDRILDMARTFVNLTGDTLAAVVVDKLTRTMDVNLYNKEKKRFLFF